MERLGIPSLVSDEKPTFGDDSNYCYYNSFFVTNIFVSLLNNRLIFSLLVHEVNFKNRFLDISGKLFHLQELY